MRKRFGIAIGNLNNFDLNIFDKGELKPAIESVLIMCLVYKMHIMRVHVKMNMAENGAG